ncbi:hypothetical protein BG004_007293 [Podila humilis]|nr:hypothetical protein BG004_007293 [Podila humilis]
MYMEDISQRGNIDRLASDGVYRLGSCIFIPQDLNFGKELLEDLKTARLFQGTDLESCRKGIDILRALMVETAETMKHRLPKLRDEHAALLVGYENSDNKEAQVLEEAMENICDQHEIAPKDTTLTNCDNQSMITDEESKIDCDDDNASEPSHPLVADMNPCHEMKAAATTWTFNDGDEDDSFLDFGTT